MPGRIILLSGDSGVGKTTICKHVVEAATARGYRCAGLLCEPIVENGQRVGSHATDLATGRQRELTRTDRVLSKLQVGRWSFNPLTLEWGNAIFRGLGECDLLVIDEIGSLEVEQGMGWADAWGALERRRFAMALVIVRPRWVKRVHNLIAAKQVLTATRATRDELPAQIIGTLDSLVSAFRERTRLPETITLPGEGKL